MIFYFNYEWFLRFLRMCRLVIFWGTRIPHVVQVTWMLFEGWSLWNFRYCIKAVLVTKIRIGVHRSHLNAHLLLFVPTRLFLAIIYKHSKFIKLRTCWAFVSRIKISLNTRKNLTSETIKIYAASGKSYPHQSPFF